jgi:CrcB protein
MAPEDQQEDYTVPDDYENLSEVASPSPIENPREQRYYRHESLEESRDRGSVKSDYFRKHSSLERQRTSQGGIHDENAEQNLNEVAAPPPVDEKVDAQPATGQSPPLSTSSAAQDKPPPQQSTGHERASKFATQLYTVSYLIFFSFLGTLARVGLQSLTIYPAAPVQVGVLWANFSGSVFMGFLSEDRRLFQEEWGTTSQNAEVGHSKRRDEEHGTTGEEETETEAELAARKKKHGAVKKTIPLFIGLATGFCGSFTSFSAFIRDVFFGLSNSLPVPVQHTSSGVVDSSSVIPRNGGYDFMAVAALILLTVIMCLGALKGGAHIAILLDPYTPSIPFNIARKYIDRIAVFFAFGTWLGVILLAIWPPDRPGGPDSLGSWLNETWRGEIIFALVFAPLGCLLRFYVSLRLNGRIASFPLGTFVVNIFGTMLLGMFYDLQRAPLGAGLIGGGMVGCQVLEGMMDGFCGCLTTVSTWVVELNGLRRRHAYVYGSTSIFVALGMLVIIMGSLKWTLGFASPMCTT